MPELPEVETVRRGLTKLIIGKQIKKVELYEPKSFPDYIGHEAIVLGKIVKNVRRRGKMLIIDLVNKGDAAALATNDELNHSLLCHLRMTGQMVYRGQANWGGGHPNESFVGDLPDRTTRATFTFDDGAKLFFNDQRKFGRILIWPTDEVANFTFVKKLGPEPFSSDGLMEFLARVKRHQNALIKAAILDQTVVAGIGNIYADEALWLVKVHPASRVKDLSDTQLTDIYHAAGQVMKQSIESGGSSMKNYVKADGSRGDYLDNFAKVFNRTGHPCVRCGAEIIKIRVAGRGTHICPQCQKIHQG